MASRHLTMALGVAAVLAAGDVTQSGAPDRAGGTHPPHALSDKQWLARLTEGSMRKFRFLEAPQRLPDITLVSISGASEPLSNWQGRMLLLNVWASWCSPCQDEMPVLNRIARQFADEGVAVVALSIDQKPNEASAFVQRLGLADLPLYIDPAREAAKALAVSGAPTSILVDARGRELGRIEGAADWSAAESRLLVKALSSKSRELP